MQGHFQTADSLALLPSAHAGGQRWQGQLPCTCRFCLLMPLLTAQVARGPVVVFYAGQV
jgi:hypothetical protein